MRIIFALVLAMMATFANAGEWGVQWHFLSNHFSDRAYEDWNESTDGFAVRYSFNENVAVQAGHYRNEFTVRQYNFFTNYVGADYTPLHLGPVSLGTYGWLTSGYNDYTLRENVGNLHHPSTVTSEAQSGIRHIVGLMARIDYKHFNYIVRIRPDMPGNIPAAIMSEVGYSF